MSNRRFVLILCLVDAAIVGAVFSALTAHGGISVVHAVTYGFVAATVANLCATFYFMTRAL